MKGMDDILSLCANSNLAVGEHVSPSTDAIDAEYMFYNVAQQIYHVLPSLSMEIGHKTKGTGPPFYFPYPLSRALKRSCTESRPTLERVQQIFMLW